MLDRGRNNEAPIGLTISEAELLDQILNMYIKRRLKAMSTETLIKLGKATKIIHKLEASVKQKWQQHYSEGIN